MIPDTHWMKRGLCYNQPDITPLFFSQDPAKMEKAKAYCFNCQVRAECEDYGTRTNSEGIFGGYDESQRTTRASWILLEKHRVSVPHNIQREPERLESEFLSSLVDMFDLSSHIQPASLTVLVEHTVYLEVQQ